MVMVKVKVWLAGFGTQQEGPGVEVRGFVCPTVHKDFLP